MLVAGGIWYGLSSSSSSSSLVTTPAPVSAATAADKDLVASLLTLRAVKLDGTVLTDPAFLSLRDFSTEIVPEAVGRDNPFAPLSSQAAASASTTKGAQIFAPRR